jgi:hypothetical protein
MTYLRTLLLALILISAFPLSVGAATLGLTPSTTSVRAGDIVTIRLIANTQGTAINQGDGTLQFPTDMLEVVSVSKAGSIFSLWVEEPRYSNAAGTVQYDGGVPTPGYTGASGTIISITFRAKQSGTATLSLTDAALRANDGLGTDVLRSTGGSQITILAVAPVVVPTTPTPTVPQEDEEVTPPATGSAAILSLMSPTHSAEDRWYQNASPLMQWQNPAGASAVQTIVDTDETTVPSVTYTPAITERRIATLEDGIWYFNIRARVGGEWGPVSSYTLRIDTEAPEITNASFDYDGARQLLVISGVSATDTTAGIARYEIVVDGKEPITVSAEAFTGGTYSFPYNKAGVQSVTVRVIDGAGNSAETSGTVTVPTPLANQTLWNIGGISITFAWFIVLILLISLLSLIAAGTAWYKLYVLREGAKSRREKRDKLLHRSLRIYKEDLERHLRTLERAGSKRELTDAEAEINEDLKKNVDDLERYLAKEFKKFD